MTGPMLHTVDVASDAQTIYEAVTTKAGEAAFWTSDCDIEPVVGSMARFGFPEAPADLRMRIEELSDRERVSATSRIGRARRSPGPSRRRPPEAAQPSPSTTTVGPPTIPTTSTPG